METRWPFPTRPDGSTSALKALVRGNGTREDLQRDTLFLLELRGDEIADVDVRPSSYGSSEWLSSLGMDGASFVNQACLIVNDCTGNGAFNCGQK